MIFLPVGVLQAWRGEGFDFAVGFFCPFLSVLIFFFSIPGVAVQVFCLNDGGELFSILCSQE